MLILLLRLINSLLSAYIVVLFIRMIFDWVRVIFPRWNPHVYVRQAIGLFYYLTEPPLRYIRRFVPPIRFGTVGIDVAYLVLYFLIIVLQIII
ncbi:MAG: YggT family protein [Bifidobacteriaceae bacterium]|nr:YggT family protein [Bifidobacteriaceae bacterium]